MQRLAAEPNTYTARWWTKGNEPGNPAFTGVEGAGKVWRDEGACN